MIMLILPPKGPAARPPESVMSMRTLGAEKKNLPFMLALLLAEVVLKSAEKGCGIWARAGTPRSIRMQIASGRPNLDFTMIFVLQTESIGYRSYTPKKSALILVLRGTQARCERECAAGRLLETKTAPFKSAVSWGGW